MSTLLAIDPSGDPRGHTGVVEFYYDDTTPAEIVGSWAVTGGVYPFLEWASKRHPLGRDSLVVCEHFVPYGNKRAMDIGPAYVEGAVQAFYWPQGIRVILQRASGKNSAVPDRVMRVMGAMFEGSGDHHGDRREAARHGLMYLKHSGHQPTLMKMFPPR